MFLFICSQKHELNNIQLLRYSFVFLIAFGRCQTLVLSDELRILNIDIFIYVSFMHLYYWTMHSALMYNGMELVQGIALVILF